jgi:PKD repeat protein
VIATAAVVVLAGLAAAAEAQTISVLWTAGGVDAGTTGAGQAARVTTDALGNVAVVSGPAGRDLAVTSYTASGTFRWRQTVSPSSGTFMGDWVVAAPNGDLLAVGHNVSSTGRPIAVTLVRFATDGTLLWRVDLARMLPAVARLLVDASGNAYLALNSLGDGQDIEVQKYNPSGVLLWARAISTGSAANDIATSLALSPNDANVVVTGNVGATWITANYDALTGARRWLVTAPEGPAARDVVVDATRVYATGQGVTGAGTPAISYFLTVVAYDRATGTRLWRQDRKPSDSSSAAGLRIALASDGSLAVTGQAARGFLDWYTVAFDTAGAVRWEAVRDGGLNTDEIPSAVLTLGDGTTVVTGRGGPNLAGGYIPGVTVGYDASGMLQWEAFSAQATVWATALPDGTVCAAGGYDALVTCWSAAQPSAPPAAPAGLTARLSVGSIVLAWQDNATDETAYSVERSENTGTGWTSFVALATLPVDATSYADSSFTQRSYNYRVRASNAAGYSAYSNTASITIVGDNPLPTAVMSATPSSGTAPLTVTFDGAASTDLGGFVTSWAWAFGDGTTGTGVSTTHVYVTPGTYTATLTVTDNGHATGTTSKSIVVIAPAPPAAPKSLAATALSGSSIRLIWTNASTTQTAVQIERCKGQGCTNFVQVAAAAGTATTFTDTGLASRTTYTYRVRVQNAGGLSPYSNLASARSTR